MIKWGRWEQIFMNELLLAVWGDGATHTHTHLSAQVQNDFFIVFILESFTHLMGTLRSKFVVLEEIFLSCREVIQY